MIPVSLIAAGIGFIAFLAKWVSPEASGWITYAGLAMPGILLMNFILFIIWCILRKRWGLLPASVLLLNIGYITSIFQLTLFPPTAPADAKVIRIGTYNVGNFKASDQKDTRYDITYYSRENRLDILCLQEYADHPRLNADSLGKLLYLPYHAEAYLTPSSKYGLIIFSKFPILQTGTLPFHSSRNSAMWADIQLDRRTIRMLNCHLETTNFNRKRRELEKKGMVPHTTEEFLSVYNDIGNTLLERSRRRAQQAAIVRELTDTTSYPFIVCGDFNDPPSSYTYHYIGQNLKDSFRSNGNGYGYTFRGLHHLLRIDYILYSPQFKCLSYCSTEEKWSDHNPVIAELFL